MLQNHMSNVYYRYFLIKTWSKIGNKILNLSRTYCVSYSGVLLTLFLLIQSMFYTTETLAAVEMNGALRRDKRVLYNYTKVYE